MGKNRPPERSQEKFDKHMHTFKHLNTLRDEIIARIKLDPYILVQVDQTINQDDFLSKKITNPPFRTLNDEEKFKKLGRYFRGNAGYFNENTTVDDMILHFKEQSQKIK